KSSTPMRGTCADSCACAASGVRRPRARGRATRRATAWRRMMISFLQPGVLWIDTRAVLLWAEKSTSYLVELNALSLITSRVAHRHEVHAVVMHVALHFGALVVIVRQILGVSVKAVFRMA